MATALAERCIYTLVHTDPLVEAEREGGAFNNPLLIACAQSSEPVEVQEGRGESDQGPRVSQDSNRPACVPVR
jgi:hypothetical protein